MPNWDELLGKEATCACQYIIFCRAFVFQMPSSAARTALQDLLSLNKFCGCFPNWPSFTEWLWSGLYRICPNNMQYEHRTNGQKLDRNTCFSRMCSKGSRFTLVEGVFARRCVHNRNRSRAVVWGPYGRPYGEFCKKWSLYGGFQCHVASFRVAGVALRDRPTCFIMCWKLFGVVGASFQEDELQF